MIQIDKREEQGVFKVNQETRSEGFTRTRTLVGRGHHLLRAAPSPLGLLFSAPAHLPPFVHFSWLSSKIKVKKFCDLKKQKYYN